MIPLRFTPRLAQAITALAVSIGVGLAAAPAADAGDYTVRYCQSGKALQDFKADFRGATGVATSTCATGGVIRVQMDPTIYLGRAGLAAELRPGLIPVYLRARGTLQFTIPAGGRLYGGVTDDECTSGLQQGCENGQVRNLVVDRVPSANTPLFVQVACLSGADPNPCANSSGQVDVSQFDVTFRDGVAPAGSAALTGLRPPADGTPVRGTQTMQFSASDADGSGVKRIETRIDGQTIAASPNQCEEPYDRMQPCGPSAGGDLAVDTSRVADGTHDLTVVAIDASGNEATIASTSTVTQNSPDVGPGSDVGLRGAVNGSYAADDAKLSAWWPATARAASKKKTVKRRCSASKSYRRTHKVACDGRPPQAKLRVSYSKKKTNLVRGRLVTAGGNPVTAATVRVVATPSATAASSSTVATAVTDGTGRFKASVPVAAGSAAYSVQWAARARDTRPAATAKLTRAVRAGSSISVTPGRVVYRRQRLVFSGKLSGATGTPKGTAVLVQVNAGKGWRALTTVRARPSGRWTAPYRVLPQLHGSYRFRALIKPSAAYAYASGTSRAIPVRVR